MKLQTLEMHRFGKFRDKQMTLVDGLNVWSSANESGKSTTADFIRFIFYGFEKSRARRALADNLLEKYQPWDSDGVMSGALELTDAQGQFYRIERTQDANGRGQVRILDGEGKQLDKAVPGEYFFGIDSETFANIYYIRQGENTPHRTAGMDVAMKNLMTTGSEEISFDSVMKFLQAEKAKYSSPKRQMGKLKNLQEGLGELERSIAYKTAALQEQKKCLQAPVEIESKIAEKARQMEEMGEQKRQHQAYAAFVRLQKREQLQQQQRQILRELEEECPSDEETGRLYDILSQLERATVRKEQAEKHVLELQQNPVSVSVWEQTVLESHRALNESTAKSLIFAGAVITAIGAAAGMLSKWCMLLCGVGLLLAAWGLFKRRLPSALRAQGIQNKAQLLQALTDAAAAKQAALYYESTLDAAVKEAETYQKELLSLEEKYRPILRQTGVFSMAELEVVQTRQVERRMMVAKQEEIAAQLALLAERAAEDAQIADNTPPQNSLEEIEAQLEQIGAQKEELLRLLADNAALAAQVAANEEVLSAEQQKKEMLAAEYEKCAFLNEVASVAIDAMQSAQQKLRENYAPALRDKVEKNLSLLTGGRYDTVVLDEQFSLRIKADGGLRQLDFFSQGTKDAAFLALRLALAQIVEAGRGVPMIFDDPFLNFDRERLLALKECLQKLGQQRQILLFSCRDF